MAGANEPGNGASGEKSGDERFRALIHTYGYRSSLRLDSRFRLRLPDDVTAHLRAECGRVCAGSSMPPGAFSRLAFYLVPGPQSIGGYKTPHNPIAPLSPLDRFPWMVTRPNDV